MKRLNFETMADWKKKFPDWWWIGELMPEDENAIESIGMGRYIASRGVGWKNRSKDECGRDDVHGAAGEWAIETVFNLPIRIPVSDDYKKISAGADNGALVESKARREDDPYRWDIAVNLYDLKPDRIYALTLTCLYPKWLVHVGWEWGSVISTGDIKRHSTRGHEFVVFPWERLRKPKEMFQFIR